MSTILRLFFAIWMSKPERYRCTSLPMLSSHVNASSPARAATPDIANGVRRRSYCVLTSLLLSNQLKLYRAHINGTLNIVFQST